VRAVTALVLVAALAGCSGRFGAQGGPAWERQEIDSEHVKPEAPVALPAYPRDADLIEFLHGRLGSHRYFVDPASVSIGADGVVRYTAVVKTSGGATNVSYEGLRCRTEEKRIYALGQPGRTWLESKRTTWERIHAYRASDYQVTLHQDFFCPDRQPVGSREAAIRALRLGLRATDTRRSSD